jgi:hypothetical protein
MSEPLRFTTVRIGVAALTSGGQVFESDVRILLASDGKYRLLSGTLSEPLSSIEDAVARAEESEPRPPDVSYEVRWRDNSGSVGSGEHPCPICGAPALALVRYPHRLCPACVTEAVDSMGRRLSFGNSDASGGFEARYAEDGSHYDGSDCFVRGVRCRAEENRFGGIVVQPIPA